MRAVVINEALAHDGAVIAHDGRHVVAHLNRALDDVLERAVRRDQALDGAHKCLQKRNVSEGLINCFKVVLLSCCNVLQLYFEMSGSWLMAFKQHV